MRRGSHGGHPLRRSWPFPEWTQGARGRGRVPPAVGPYGPEQALAVKLLLAPFITFPEPVLVLLSELIPVLSPEPNTLLLMHAFVVPSNIPWAPGPLMCAPVM